MQAKLSSINKSPHKNTTILAELDSQDPVTYFKQTKSPKNQGSSSPYISSDAKKLADGSEYFGHVTLVTTVKGEKIEEYTDLNATIKYSDGRIYQGPVVNGLKEGSGKMLLQKKGDSFRGLYQAGKAISGTYTFHNGRSLSWEQMAGGSGVSGTKCVCHYAEAEKNIKSMSGAFSGNLDFPFNGQVTAEIIVNGNLANFSGLSTKNQLIKGQIRSVFDDGLVYDGIFDENNKPWFDGVYAGEYKHQIIYTSSSGETEALNPRKFAEKYSHFIYTNYPLYDKNITAQVLEHLSQNSMVQPSSLSFVTNSEQIIPDAIGLKETNRYGISCYARRDIKIGEIVTAYTGLNTYDESNKKDVYKMEALLPEHVVTLEHFANEARFLQCLPSREKLAILLASSFKPEYLPHIASANLSLSTFVNTQGKVIHIFSASREIKAGEILGYDYLSLFRNAPFAIFDRQGEVLSECLVDINKNFGNFTPNMAEALALRSKESLIQEPDREINITEMHSFIYKQELSLLGSLEHSLNMAKQALAKYPEQQALVKIINKALKQFLQGKAQAISQYKLCNNLLEFLNDSAATYLGVFIGGLKSGIEHSRTETRQILQHKYGIVDENILRLLC